MKDPRTTDGATISPDSTYPVQDTESGESKVIALKEQKLKLLQEKQALRRNLPHKYGFKKYKWQSEFFYCYEQDAFLTAANQIGKSTIQIATAIEWATNKKLWPILFKRRTPRVFWYFYPSLDLATDEFNTKWVPDLMPSKELRDDPVYGWKEKYNGRYIHAVEFNTGVTFFFKAYSQDVMKLQAATVDAVFCDEELPEEYWDELNWRRSSTKGLFRMAFTATIGQKIWFDTMERRGDKEEKFPHAKKWQISLHDCKTFEDGSQSHIDDEYIARAIMLCKSEAEVQKRVYGRFASDSGLKYPTFNRKLNTCPPRNLPRNWHIFVGVDIGAGGDENHPSAIVFVGVSPDYTKAEVFEGWMGTDRLTTDMDVYEQLVLMMGEMSIEDRISGIFYDYHAKDFHTICERNGLSVQKADKSHETGEAVIGVLFKTMNLTIHDKASLDMLCFQLSNLKRDTNKRHAKDDFIDGMRYAITRVPFDWHKIGVTIQVKQAAPTPRETEEDSKLRKRREMYLKSDQERDQIVDIDTEMNAWSELHEF